MITNILLVLGLTLGAFAYMKMHMELKELKAESKCNYSALEYSIENSVSCIEKQIKQGNIRMSNHLDMIKKDTSEIVELNIPLLKVDSEFTLSDLEQSIQNSFPQLKNEIKYGNVGICNHLDMVEENTAELINQRTRDINFITTRETNKVIFTPLKIECERCK